MKKSIPLTLLLICLSIYSYSQIEWQLVCSDQNTKYYMKQYRSPETLDIKTVWQKHVYKVMKCVLPSGKQINVSDGYAIILFSYDCKNRKSKLVSFTNYYPNGKAAYSANVEADAEPWTYVMPESTGELLLNKACESF